MAPRLSRQAQQTIETVVVGVLAVIAAGLIIWLTLHSGAYDERMAGSQGVTQPKGEKKDELKAGAKDGKEKRTGPKSFDEAWAAAVDLAVRLETEEPTKTAAAAKLLGPDDLARVRPYLTAEPEALGAETGDTTPAAILVSRGMGEYARAQSSRVARADAKFKKVMRAFWSPGAPPAEITGAMRLWLTILPAHRAGLIAAVEENGPRETLRPAVRDAALLLGGEEWLSK